MPGWGKSDTAVPGDRDHVEALELALDALELDSVAIVGNSLGGSTALRFTAHHPERVSHLIPMGAPAPGVNQLGPPNDSTEGIHALVRVYLDPSPANFQAMVGALAHDPALAEHADLARRRSEAALARPDHLENVRLSLPRGDLNGPPQLFQALPPLLAKLTVPTLIVHGRNDRTVHFENSLRLLAMIPSARLYLINNCSHWAQMEHSEEFNRVVHEFITLTPSEQRPPRSCGPPVPAGTTGGVLKPTGRSWPRCQRGYAAAGGGNLRSDRTGSRATGHAETLRMRLKPMVRIRTMSHPAPCMNPLRDCRLKGRTTPGFPTNGRTRGSMPHARPRGCRPGLRPLGARRRSRRASPRLDGHADGGRQGAAAARTLN